ncbi:hypothetical protein AAT17_03740 [Nonlabens sp. MIC269]|uniref:hypothetical protein n=1 Tax=Nonlabens sp. MIC269 TaxID=1476901 RepID=UPI00072062CB|nr:hypothetical protein [Nonlabens sp. MIC269]ALM20406.1 hypothetical protein AAT17_03740 [Nonlabens sp. MIC269]
MKKLFVTLLFLLSFAFAKAQQFDDMGEYLNFMNKEYRSISKRSWKLTQAVAHSKRDKTIQKRKQQLIKAINNSMNRIKKAETVGGDEYKNETLKIMQFRIDIMNEEFEKVIDLEKIAQESYDAMEAYILAQEALDEKSAEVELQYEKAVKEFGNKNNINFTDEESELGNKMRKAGEVFDYKNDLFLIYFKVKINEIYLFQSLEKQDVNGLQQNANALKTEALAGIEKLKTYKGFNNDKSLILAINKSFKNYVKMADTYIAPITDFLIYQKDFEKLKTTLDKTSPNKRTKKMVDDFNKKVDEVNKKLKLYNKAQSGLVNNANKFNTSIANSFDNFVQKHIPKD